MRLMRAIRITAPRQFTIEELPEPEPGRSQVRIHIEGCGVCGSNLAAWQGREWFEYPQPPGAPGHEGWGTVDAVGRDVRDLAVGQRVAPLSFRAYAEYDV